MPSKNLEEFKEFYKLHPKTKKGESNQLYYDECPRVNRQTVKSWVFRLQQVVQPVETKTIKKSNQNSQPPNFIDVPDELLMSVSIRELNRENPDPRWASILITTRKENIGQSKKEGKLRSRFMSMNIKEVARISAKKLTDTSQKPDLKESS